MPLDLSWDLEALYPSFSSDKFRGDQELLQHKLESLCQWAVSVENDKNENIRQLESFLQRYNAFQSQFTCLFSYAELVLAANSSNVEAMNILAGLEEKSVIAANALSRFNQWLVAIDGLESMLDSSAYLEEHRFYLRQLQNHANHTLHADMEELIARMQSTGSKAWEHLYMRSISSVSADVFLEGDIKCLSLAELHNMACDPDVSIRKAAYEAEQKALKSIVDQSTACINGISGEALTVYRYRGYPSPLDKVMAASRMERGTLDAMMDAIRAKLPLFHTYYRKKAEVLGYSSGLPFYDVFAPVGRGAAKVS